MQQEVVNVLAELVSGLAAGNDVVDDDQERVSARHKGVLGPTPRREASGARG